MHIYQRNWTNFWWRQGKELLLSSRTVVVWWMFYFGLLRPKMSKCGPSCQIFLSKYTFSKYSGPTWNETEEKNCVFSFPRRFLFDKCSILSCHGQKCQKVWPNCEIFDLKCTFSRNSGPMWNENIEKFSVLFLNCFCLISVLS